MGDQPVLPEKSIISHRNASVSEWTLPRILKIKTSRDTKCSLEESSILCSISYLFFSTNYFSTPPGVSQNKKKLLHTLRAPTAAEAKSRVLPLTPLRPNRSNSMNRHATRTRQPAMSPPILSPPNLLLRLPHPVRNNKNTNQLLHSNTPAPSDLLQLQENTTIQNLHKFH
jgi:hypothetical protein